MKLNLFFLFLLACCSASSQITREKLFSTDSTYAFGNYCAYWGGKSPVTPAPKGYKPFYVSHYARHGSRYLISNSAYHRMIPFLEQAQKDDQLTDLGITMLERFRKTYEACKGQGGKLSKLGGIQHEQIAHRMFEHYPEIFTGNSFVHGYSSPADRSIKSMEHFCAELKRLNPNLDIQQSSESKWLYITRPNHDSIASTAAQKEVQKRAQRMQDSLKKTINISSLIFKDPSYVTQQGKKHYAVASDFYEALKSMPSLPEINLDFNVFTQDQMFTYFKLGNVNWMERTYLIPGEQPYYKRSYSLLQNMISWADEVIKQGKNGASVRFGHDTYVMPLAYVMGIEGCTNFPASDWENANKYFAAYQIVPMASNVQLVFFRKKGSDDVLVKVLLQEEEKHIPVKTDIWPFYHWKDVKAYYLNYMYKENPIEYLKKEKLHKTDDKEINT